MKNYLQDGGAVTVTAPHDVKSGQGVKLNDLFGVAMGDASSGDDVVLQMTGVIRLDKKPLQDWDVGTSVYWDDVNKHVTKSASGNMKIGVSMASVSNSADDVLGNVRLSG